jgi:cellobiose phosphorylase
MALIGAPLVGYDTSREAFLGPYRSYDRPLVVERGRCTNSDAYGDNACGVLQTDLTLGPGETRQLLVMLGIGTAETVGKATVAEFGSPERAEREFARLKEDRHSKLGSFIVQTPDEDLNHMLNVWGLYNCLITFAWSRSASLVYNGERDGLGFRDSVQDVLGVVTATPDAARERLELMLTGQMSSGGAMPIASLLTTTPAARGARPKRSTAPTIASGSSTPSPPTWPRPAM